MRSLPLRLGLFVLGLSIFVAHGDATPLDCTSTPDGAPPFVVELVSPTPGQAEDECEVRVVGHAELETPLPWDVYIVVDSSGSTAGASGIDLDGDGVLGQGDWRNNTDPDDSTLRAELEAVRRALDAWDGLDVRVSLEEYSAVIPIPPGEPEEQGRIRTVQGLTADFNLVRAGLDVIAAAGSAGATDYGGALFELAAEFERSGDPSRRPIAFFLSDGKPTFPRFPFDLTEPVDVQYALEGAAAVAALGLPVNTLEIGTFDDIGVLSSVASITNGELLAGLVGNRILDSIADMAISGFEEARLLNETTGQERDAGVDRVGEFSATIDLEPGQNSVVLTASLETGDGSWLITCPIEIEALCYRDRVTPGSGRPGASRPGDTTGTLDAGSYGALSERLRGSRGGAGGAGGRRRFVDRHPGTRASLSRWDLEPCVGLAGNAGFGEDCDEAARQLTALYRSIEDGELREDCPLDRSLVPDHATVGELIEALASALDRGSQQRCADAAAAANEVTSGAGLASPPIGPTPSGNQGLACELLLDSEDFEMTVNVTSPTPDSEVGNGGDCPSVRIEGQASARGDAVQDVYFVVDTSGSTAGSSGRDVDGDGSMDSTLEAELGAVRAFIDRLDPALVRVALIEFSAVIPIPPGEFSEQGRIRTVHPLSSDFQAVVASMDLIRSDGSVGATDYGGALLELAAEYDRNGDPSRGNIAFFLSDGKPTFPRFPFDTTEPVDVGHALDGAQACADRGIVVNTFEVGVFDDLSTLFDVAERTGGLFHAALGDGAILDALPGSTLVGVQTVLVSNSLTGTSVEAEIAPDGSFVADIDLAEGENQIVIRVSSDRGEEVVECRLAVTGDCHQEACAVRSPAEWRESDCP